MLDLGIDLHKTQITINLRNENGDVLQTGQISTDHDVINEFFGKLVKRAGKARGFMAIFEVCGFHDWLYEKLKNAAAKRSSLFSPTTRPGKKRIVTTPTLSANSLGTTENALP